MDHKICTKCCQDKPLDAFYKHKNGKYGHGSACKQCCRVDGLAYREANIEAVRARGRKHYEANREAIREYHKAHGPAYRAANRDKLNANSRAWHKANSEKAKAYARAYPLNNREANLARKRKYRKANREKLNSLQRAYQKANPEVKRNNGHRRRAKAFSAGVYLVTKKDIARLLRQPCAYCGAVAEHIDHVTPISRGGAHKIGNLVAACSSCNLRKGSKLLSVWRLGNSGQQGKVEK